MENINLLQTKPCNIALIGPKGRMGRMLVSSILSHPNAHLVSAIAPPDSSYIGEDVGSYLGLETTKVEVSDCIDDIRNADAVIDFTTPSSTAHIAPIAARFGVAHIIGTTGLDDLQTQSIHQAARTNTIVWASNFSVGVTLLKHLTTKVASTLGNEFDIEIVEMHHNQKKDAPSGTALDLGKAAAQGRGIDIKSNSTFTRHGQTGARAQGSIGFSTIRGGDVIGDHTVMFAGLTERIELSHKAQNRNIFSLGAIQAALWAVKTPSGLYDMSHVLGLTI